MIPMGEVIARELQVFGSHGMAAHSYPNLLALELPIGRLVTRRIGLEATPTGTGGDPRVEAGSPSSSPDESARRDRSRAAPHSGHGASLSIEG